MIKYVQILVSRLDPRGTWTKSENNVCGKDPSPFPAGRTPAHAARDASDGYET